MADTSQNQDPKAGTTMATSPQIGAKESSKTTPAADIQDPFQAAMSLSQQPPSPQQEQTPQKISPYDYRNALHRPIPSLDHSPFSVDQISRKALPYPLPWKQTKGPDHMEPDFSWISQSCGGKAAIGVFGGGVMGLLMGVFLGAMSDATPPVTVVAGKEVPNAPLKEQMRVVARATSEKSIYWCKNFAFITGVFGGSECLVEKYRGKHDVWNSVASGCEY